MTSTSSPAPPHRDSYCQNTDAGLIYAAAAVSFCTNLLVETTASSLRVRIKIIHVQYDGSKYPVISVCNHAYQPHHILH